MLFTVPEIVFQMTPLVMSTLLLSFSIFHRARAATSNPATLFDWEEKYQVPSKANSWV